MSDTQDKKRIIIPSKRPQVSSSLVINEPPVDQLINDATNIISIELVKFRARVDRGQSLTLPEARVLQGYIKSLCELSKEARDRLNSMDFAKMSTEQLISLLEKLVQKRATEEIK